MDNIKDSDLYADIIFDIIKSEYEDIDISDSVYEKINLMIDKFKEAVIQEYKEAENV